MARGTGRTIPSVLGGGLAGGTRAILDAVLERERRESQEALEGRRLDIAERADALNRFTTLAGFFPAGTTLGELGESGAQMFSDAFDMDASGLQDLELTPETLQTALDARWRSLLDTGELDESLIMPSLRAILGLEPSETVAEARDLEAEMRINAYGQISRDPVMAREFVSRELGRTPITLTIPGIGDDPATQISFNSERAAQIYADFLLNRERFGFQLELESIGEESPVVKSIRDAVAEAGHSVGLPAIMRVLEVYNRAIETQDLSVIQRHMISNVAPGEKLALQFLLGSIGIGEEAFLAQMPENFANYLRLQNIVGAETDPSDTIELLKSMTRIMDPSFVPTLKDPFWGGLQFDMGEQQEGAPPPTGQQGMIGVPDEAIRQAHEMGDSREDLANMVGQERVDEVLGPAATPAGAVLDPSIIEGALIPEGGMNPDAVPIPFRADVQQLNNLIRRLERTEGELARRNLEGAITRLRERIRAGVSGG